MKKKHQILLLICIILIIGARYHYIILHDVTNMRQKSIHNVYQYSTVGFGSEKFDIAKIKPKNINSLSFYYKDENNQKFTDIGHLKNQKEELIFATNGGIFSKTYEPLGLYIENGVTISKLNTNGGEGNFYLQPNGIFLIKRDKAEIIETKKYQNSSNTLFATQSGPLLVVDNKINSSFDENSSNKYIRNGVGIDKKGNIFFAISNQPVTFYEFASFFKEQLKCNYALYLDGAISEMYVPKYRENTKEKFAVMIGVVNR